MSENNSTFLNNTLKDLVGNLTALVLLGALIRGSPSDRAMDSNVRGFLEKQGGKIRKLVQAVVLAAHAKEIVDEALGTINDLVPRQSGYYDQMTVNALLSLYAGDKHIRNFWGMTGTLFAEACRHIFERKLRSTIFVTLWCRVEAYERDAKPQPLDLTTLYVASIVLLPRHYRPIAKTPQEWLDEVTNAWRQSEPVTKGLRLTGTAGSGLRTVLSEIAAA